MDDVSGLEIIDDELYISFGDDGLIDDSSSTGYSVEILIVRLLICIFGVTGNALVILVVLVLQEYKKTVTHWYVLHLAIADSLFLLSIPFKVVEDAKDEWTFSGGMCKATEAVLFLNYFTSVFLLMVMSLDRYIAVCHGRSSTLEKFRTRRSAYLITCVVWIISLISCVPVFLYSDKRGTSPKCKCTYEFPKDPRISCIDMLGPTNESAITDCMRIEADKEPCVKLDIDEFTAFIGVNMTTLTNELSGFGDLGPETNEGGSAIEEKSYHYNSGCTYAGEGIGWFHYLNFLFVAMFLIPLLVMGVCYTLIIRQLRKTQVRHNFVTSCQTTNGSQNGKSRRTLSAAALKSERNFRRVNIICITLVLLFAICWLPFHSYHLARKNGIKGSGQYCENLLTVVSTLTYVNSALNPFVFNFIGTRFGKRLRSAASSVRTSVKRRTSSLSSTGGGVVRYKPKREMDNSSVSGTVVTKVQAGKSEIESLDRDDDARCAMMVKEQSE